MKRKKLKRLIVIIVLMMLPGLPGILAQEVDVIFSEPQARDTITSPARPIDGYPALLKLLEGQLAEGDTLGKSIALIFGAWALR